MSENAGLRRALDKLEKLTFDFVKRPAEPVNSEPDLQPDPDNAVHQMQAATRDAFTPAEAPRAERKAKPAKIVTPTLLSMKQASAITTLSVSSIKRMMAAGTFPRPVRLGESRIAFVEEELHAWLRERIAARD
ncbi:helix-turn-helix transcriptional regulator [Oryzibacter oryziterrae]|uniref:helix-turn-helix transcriptional regulator n=1 Tax=Oryzibacter oryziterrae TaxID=2766474 RepID=UPI001F47639E|nr:AlpA family phage regulatory protein [Oryzibacter oryziterrae]